MANEQTYYEILGVEPTADDAAIEGAYHGRSLRFRVGLFDGRPRELSGPTQAEVERAYAVLSDPTARAAYDATLFPAGPPPPDRRSAVGPWLWWTLAALAIAAIVGMVGWGMLRERRQASNDPVTRIVAGDSGLSATATANAAIVPTSTPPATPVVSPTAPASSTTVALAPTATAAATAMAAAPTATRPPLTVTATRAATAAAPPTATVPAPTATPTLVLTATVEPPPPPPPTPTPAAIFEPTDRIGTSRSVNLRTGPGVTYGINGVVAPGTLLEAAGETATVNGVLWRRFYVSDGRIGWIRDIDVLPVP